jgi:hypothetical protein
MADPKTYKVTLSWAALPNATSYRIYKRIGSGTDSYLGAVTATSYVFTGLAAPLSQYKLSVEANYPTCISAKTTVTPQEPA